MSTGEPLCFVIAPIGEAGSAERKRSDQVLKYVIEPAAQECKYTARRADHPMPGMITAQVIQAVIESPMVVADLTAYNPNVFYELAIRHFVKKPVIHLIERGYAIPFDVRDMRTVIIDTHDWDSRDEARREIVAHLRFFQKNPTKVATPISITLDLEKLMKSETSTDRQLAAVMVSVEGLSAQVAALTQALVPRRVATGHEWWSELATGHQQSALAAALQGQATPAPRTIEFEAPPRHNLRSGREDS